MGGMTLQNRQVFAVQQGPLAKDMVGYWERRKVNFINEDISNFLQALADLTVATDENISPGYLQTSAQASPLAEPHLNEGFVGERVDLTVEEIDEKLVLRRLQIYRQTLDKLKQKRESSLVPGLSLSLENQIQQTKAEINRLTNHLGASEDQFL